MNHLHKKSENLSQNHSFSDFSSPEGSKNKQGILSLLERAELCTNPVAKELLRIVHEKKSNLAVAADVTKKNELLWIAEQVGPFICMLKTHIDIIDDFDWDIIVQLQALAKKHNFLIFEDRKFADIGNTVKMQYGQGIYRIADWADVINAHTVPGPSIIQGLQEVGAPKNRGLILIPQMSSAGNLASGEYTQKTLAMAEEYHDFVIGFIAREKLSDNTRFIHFTPGVQLQEGGDALGQQYLTPGNAVRNGSDVIIVGRGIIKADNPARVAQQYRDEAWLAYQTII